MQLNSIEGRIIGCLLEKEVTTPEQYPLSLNALTLACNQKTSREPVMSLSETDVQAGLDSLNKKRLISEQSGFGSRVSKYKHRFCNTEFSDLQFTKAEFAIISLLLLRGPQTPGELRTRAGRLHDFTDIDEVESALSALSSRAKPVVKMLPREPGKRESRYTELFSEGSDELPVAEVSTTQRAVSQPNGELAERVAHLESEVTELKTQLAELRSLLE
ncbi:YceH family protein [Shewanella sp. GXUN23E]|uniref:YceH family protein n=1 Tax=Shewanella sp. GXUN23E TaxID=3422498 RepID=UPI003D7E7414